MWREFSDYNDHCYRMSYSSYNFTSSGALIVPDVTTPPFLFLITESCSFLSKKDSSPSPPKQKKNKWKGGGIFWPIFSRSFLSVSNHSLFFGKVFILEKKTHTLFPSIKTQVSYTDFIPFLKTEKLKIISKRQAFISNFTYLLLKYRGKGFFYFWNL